MRYVFKKSSTESTVSDLKHVFVFDINFLKNKKLFIKFFKISDTIKKSETINVNIDQNPTFKIIHKEQEAIHSFCTNEVRNFLLQFCNYKKH
jgi:hypothetical protein